MTAFFVLANEEIQCPICEGELFFRDWRARGVINELGEKELYSYLHLQTPILVV